MEKENLSIYDWFATEAEAWAVVFELWAAGIMARTPAVWSENTFVVRVVDVI